MCLVYNKYHYPLSENIWGKDDFTIIAKYYCALFLFLTLANLNGNFL